MDEVLGMPPSFGKEVTRSREPGDQGGEPLLRNRSDSSDLSAEERMTFRLTVIFDSDTYKDGFVGSRASALIRRSVRM